MFVRRPAAPMRVRLARLVARTALTAIAAATATPAAAQRAGPTFRPAIELRPVVGAFVPMGAQRDLLTDAVLVGAQGSWHLHPIVALTGAVVWSPTRDRTTAVRAAPGALFTGRRETVDLVQLDAGIEVRPFQLFRGRAWTLNPFFGAGAGVRWYGYRDVDGTETQSNALGYLTNGFDVRPRMGRIAFRFETRNNFTAFDGLRGERADRTTRYDLGVQAGLTVRF